MESIVSWLQHVLLSTPSFSTRISFHPSGSDEHSEGIHVLASNKIAKQWIVCDSIFRLQVHLQRGKEKVTFTSQLFKDL